MRLEVCADSSINRGQATLPQDFGGLVGAWLARDSDVSGAAYLNSFMEYKNAF
jgi:hypothetical protein